MTTTTKRCPGGFRGRIDPHDAPMAAFTRNATRKDGLSRLCRACWVAYTTTLRPTTTCSVVGCGRRLYSRGYCRPHWQRQRHGQPIDLPIRRCSRRQTRPDSRDSGPSSAERPARGHGRQIDGSRRTATGTGR